MAPEGERSEGPQELFVPGWRGDTLLDEIYERCHDVVYGKGTFGTVYKGRHRATGELVAIKRLPCNVQDIPAAVLREVGVLRDFNHPNIVRLIDMQIINQEYHLVFEHADGDLHKEIRALRHSGVFMPLWQLARWSLDLLSGIHNCHARQIMHRDLKPENILVTATGLKICDFGLARLCPPEDNGSGLSVEVVTLWYRAPELLLGARDYGPQVDMWSFGCIFAEMATSYVMFPGDSEIGTLFLMFRLLGTPTEQTWPGVTEFPWFKRTFPRWCTTNVGLILQHRPDMIAGHDLLRDLLALDPKIRMSARKAKANQFFDPFRG